ncbi:DNA polymerase III subunit gamma/tau [Patescibacteria group bacterium]|nr:DNA polymerase III subunit gamma/tau [Patescibacteria group bacterium]
MATNLVLYRKYRPQSFGEVIGQDHVVQTLKNAVRANLIAHAYLFSGPRGSGKTTLARILAKAVNCKNPKQGEPDNTCESCQEINQGRALDFIEIDAASNRGIDEIRELKEGIRFVPARLKYKVFVIDEAHQLTKEASNALLKTLEEPPSHAIFVLATTEVHRMIGTIVSRCQRFDFRRLQVPEIVERLQDLAKKEKATIDKQALLIIAGSAGGSFRDAESLLDRVLTFHAGNKITQETVQELLGIVDIHILSKFVDLLFLKKAAQPVEFLNKKLQEGMDPQEFAKNLVEYLRNLLILKLNPELKDTLTPSYTKEQQEKIAEQAKAVEGKFLTNALKLFMAAERDMRYADIVQLPLELAIVESTMKEE